VTEKVIGTNPAPPDNKRQGNNIWNSFVETSSRERLEKRKR